MQGLSGFPKGFQLGVGCLVVLRLIFNSLLSSSLGQTQEQQPTILKGNCQENSDIQQRCTYGDCTVCVSRCYMPLQPIKGKSQDMNLKWI